MPHYSHYAWLNINFTKVHKELNIFYHSRELIYYGSIVSLSIPENSITYVYIIILCHCGEKDIKRNCSLITKTFNCVNYINNHNFCTSRNLFCVIYSGSQAR